MLYSLCIIRTVDIQMASTATEEQIAYYTKQFGLDQPLPVQYIRWIGGLFKGEMGRSITYSIDVKELIYISYLLSQVVAGDHVVA